MTKSSFKDLVVWQRAVDLVPHAYQLIARFPREEAFALSDQIRRAVVSVAANIAEGQARQYPKEFVQHLMIAKGSLAEVQTLMIVAERLNYISTENLASIEERISGLRAPLAGLIAKLRK